MSKLSKLFKAISLILKQPSLLNKVLDDEDVNRQQVLDTYGLSKGLKTVDILQLLPNLNQTVAPYAAYDGGSTPLDLALLKGLAAATPDCDYFEIGTWMGESAANVAAVARQCVSLNLPDAEMQRMGLDKKYIGLHRFFSEKLVNVKHIQANSQTFDYAALNQKFDLVFVDGDHHYESVKNDTANAFSVLKNSNSIIVWHDYGNTPAATDIRWDVLRGILDGTPADKRNNLYRVSNTLCAIYTTQPISAIYPETYTAPNKTFAYSVAAKQL